jgi:DNA-binding transcriptional MerR regulator
MPRLTPKEGGRSFLQTAEVASLIGITKQTILNWINDGRILDAERNPVNNYRQWTEHDVERIRHMIRERSLAKTRRR